MLYKLTVGSIRSEGKRYIIYGIRTRSGCGRSVYIKDLSTDLFSTLKFIRILNKLKPETYQLADIIEDFLP